MLLYNWCNGIVLAYRSCTSTNNRINSVGFVSSDGFIGWFVIYFINAHRLTMCILFGFLVDRRSVRSILSRRGFHAIYINCNVSSHSKC